MKTQKCECCDRNFSTDPLFVKSDDGYESFAVCSQECVEMMAENLPTADGIAEVFDGPETDGDDAEVCPICASLECDGTGACDPNTFSSSGGPCRMPTPAICLNCGHEQRPVYDECLACGALIPTEAEA